MLCWRNTNEKVYLETPEAVIKALKAAKEVFLDEGGAGKVVLIDGFCVKQWNDQFNINYTINLRDKPYILEEEPLKIEVGQWYEMRNHNVARCYNAEGDRRYFSIDNGGIFQTDSEGYFKCKDKPYDLDIIGPWEE